MTIRFTCPNPTCRAAIAVKDEFAGRTGKCPSCKSGVSVPAARAVAAVRAAPTPPPAAAAAGRRPPAVERPPKANKPEPEVADVEPLDRTEWLVRRDVGLFSGNTVAGLFDGPEAREPSAVVRDASLKLFGFIKIDVFGFRPRLRYEVRLGDKNGPVAVTLERFIPLFELPLIPPKPTRWEVHGPDGELLGSLNLSREGFSLLKLLSKGQFFQDDHFLLDADDRRAGTLVVERGLMGAPNRFILRDEEGNKLGSTQLEKLRRGRELIEEAQRDGKVKVKFSFNVMGHENDEARQWRGVSGRVHPDRADDPFARAMTLALCLLLEVVGYDRFASTRSAG
jgi:hypothetical protein